MSVLLAALVAGAGGESAGTDDSEPPAGCAGDEGRHDVGGVPVQGLAATVVSHRRSRVGVTRRFLHVTQRDAGIEGCGDERVTQRVRPDSLDDPSLAGDASHNPPSRVPIQPLPVGVEEDRTCLPFPIAKSMARATLGASGMVTVLPPFRSAVKVRCPRSSPNASMSVPTTSATRSPLSAMSDTNA
jgi:hypothetical protein